MMGGVDHRIALDRNGGARVLWWVLLLWVVLAAGAARRFGGALGRADRSDWRRRGEPERRTRDRGPAVPQPPG